MVPGNRDAFPCGHCRGRLVKWQELAACSGMDTGLFFPEEAEGGQAQQAKAVCARCPVRLDCLQFALDNNEPAGIYGGLTRKERRRMCR